MPVPVEIAAFRRDGLAAIGRAFDRLHERLYTFALKVDRELINLRAIVRGKEALVDAGEIPEGGWDAAAATVAEQRVYVDGDQCSAAVYNCGALRIGNVVAGPAIITQIDSTTLVLPAHEGETDRFGNILIRPSSKN